MVESADKLGLGGGPGGRARVLYGVDSGAGVLLGGLWAPPQAGGLRHPRGDSDALLRRVLLPKGGTQRNRQGEGAVVKEAPESTAKKAFDFNLAVNSHRH